MTSDIQPAQRNIQEHAMQISVRRSMIFFLAGAIFGGSVLYFRPQANVKASVANGNDKFTMVTVPISVGETEAVFVLNHLTGVLRGAVLNPNTGTFTNHYLRNVAADFETAASTPDPKYAIVSAPAFLRSAGPAQPANGVIYIGELSSGAVICYSFALPRGRNVTGMMELGKLDFFKFAEGAGG